MTFSKQLFRYIFESKQVDKKLYTINRIDHRVYLTKEGEEKAFAIGAGVNKKFSQSLLQLHVNGGSVYIMKYLNGRINFTPFGKEYNSDMKNLAQKGLVEFFGPNKEQVRLTRNGKMAIKWGIMEINYLIKRIESLPELQKLITKKV